MTETVLILSSALALIITLLVLCLFGIFGKRIEKNETKRVFQLTQIMDRLFENFGNVFFLAVIFLMSCKVYTVIIKESFSMIDAWQLFAAGLISFAALLFGMEGKRFGR